MFPALERFAKYATIGCATFVLDLILLYLLIDIAGLYYVYAAGVAFLIAISINYIASREVVFSGTERDLLSGYFIFTLIAIAGLLAVMVGMYVLVETLAVHYIAARVMVAALVGWWNYLINLYYNFRLAGRYSRPKTLL